VIKIKVDIVGGSLSGLSTAISLKQHNKALDVTIHEKYKTIGYNHEGRRCGEAFRVGVKWAKWKPVGKSIFNNLTKFEAVVGDKLYSFSSKPGIYFMLNRQEFICQFAREAEKLGVNINTGDIIKSVDELDGDYIVDASGCPSTIKRELKLERGIKGITYQQTLEDCNLFVPNLLKIIITGFFPGYFWIFPRNPEKKEVNLGVGTVIDTDYKLKEILEKFKEEQVIEGKVNYIVGGLCPASFQKPLRYKNILFVGDAGIGTSPIMGTGILRALRSGDIAGYCLAAEHPEWYTKIIYQKFIRREVLHKSYLWLTSILNKIGKRSLFAIYHLYLEYAVSYGSLE
jgi:flavin-dependent dehydrogenase